MGDLTLGTPEVFVVRVSKKGSLIEDLECGCLSPTTTIAESLKPSVWVVLMYVLIKRGGKVVE